MITSIYLSVIFGADPRNLPKPCYRAERSHLPAWIVPAGDSVPMATRHTRWYTQERLQKVTTMIPASRIPTIFVPYLSCGQHWHAMDLAWCPPFPRGTLSPTFTSRNIFLTPQWACLFFIILCANPGSTRDCPWLCSGDSWPSSEVQMSCWATKSSATCQACALPPVLSNLWGAFLFFRCTIHLIPVHQGVLDGGVSFMFL